MFSPSSISWGEALSSDNRKQVLRGGEVMEGGEEDRRRMEVASVPYGGDRRGGIGSKRRRCAEPDCLKWKFLRHENAVPFTADGVRDRKVRFQR